jgi:hypothetical protein
MIIRRCGSTTKFYEAILIHLDTSAQFGTAVQPTYEKASYPAIWHRQRHYR